jgi:hypothetical protein
MREIFEGVSKKWVKKGGIWQRNRVNRRVWGLEEGKAGGGSKQSVDRGQGTGHRAQEGRKIRRDSQDGQDEGAVTG